MGRNKYSDREYSELDKLKQENKQLKKRVESLRKQISRLDIDRYNNIKELVNKYNEEDNKEQFKAEQKKLKQRWECHECRNGFLVLTILNRRDTTMYFRKCNNCNHRTKLKKYTESVEGVKE